jgi:mRNA interferase HigB
MPKSAEAGYSLVPRLGTRYTGILRVIARGTLARFVESLAGNKSQRAVKNAVDAWFHEVRRATWKNSADLKRSFGTASIINADRAVFNIKCNDFRLVVALDYRRQVAYVKWVGSHAEYDLIDAETIQYEDQADPDRR